MATSKKTVSVAARKPVATTSKPAAADKILPTPPKPSKVFWTYEEKTLLVERAARALRNVEASSSLQALRLAQDEVLPEHRRRNLISMGHSAENEWFHAMLAAELQRQREQAALAAKAAEAEAAAKAAEAQAATAPEEPAPVEAQPVNDSDVAGTSYATPLLAKQLASRMNGHAVPHADPATATPAAVSDGVASAYMNLRGMLVDELASVFLEAMLKAIGSGLLTHGETPQVQVSESHGIQRLRIAPKVRKPSVLIVGVLDKKGGGKDMLEREYGDRFDLRFIGAQENKDQLRSMTEKADTTVLLTDSISHSHQDIVKARAVKYVFCPGGMTSLRQTLNGLAH